MKPDSAIEIIQKLRAAQFEAYLVGGCVRDMVMGLEPADYDIATSAHPEQIMKLFPRTEAIGAQFGVVLVIHHGHPFEVATFRSDEAYVDGRRPTGVVFTDAKSDVLRRDFTINGLLFDPIERNILDYVSGQQDIDAKIVRAIGDPAKRFEEDKLRILRAIRFGARLGYAIEPETWKAVCAMAPQVHQVSVERIQGELVRILTEGQAGHGFQLLQDSGLLQEVLPEVPWSTHLAKCLELLERERECDCPWHRSNHRRARMVDKSKASLGQASKMVSGRSWISPHNFPPNLLLPQRHSPAGKGSAGAYLDVKVLLACTIGFRSRS